MKKHILLILWLINLTVILGLWLLGSHTYITGSLPEIFIAGGRLAGLLGEFFILTQLVLIGRVQLLERNYGFDKLNRYHRKLGFAALGLLVFHPIALSLGYSALGTGVFSVSATWGQFLTFLTSWDDVFKAFLALCILIIMVGISLAIIRKKLCYETWYFVHLLVYVAIVLAFSHQINTADVSSGVGLYYWLVINFFVFGLVLLYRFLRPLWLFARHRFYVEKVVQETPTVWSVYITGQNMEKFYFEAGQYANVTFLTRDHWYTHPFSFSAGPNGKNLRFSMKGVGDFTNEVPKILPGTRVVLDGPLGGFTLRHAATKKFLFLAGGIGVTPIRALVDTLLAGTDAAVLFAVRAESELAFLPEFDRIALAKRVAVTTFVSDEHVPGSRHGFIDAVAITELVPDVAERDVYLCGPPIMMKKAIVALKALGVPHRHIHYENFNY